MNHQSLEVPAPKRFRLVGGDLCLDFCNSVGGHRGGIARENLHSYLDFLNWCEQAGLLDKSEFEYLKTKAGADPAAADAVLSRAIELREAIYRIFAAVMRQSGPAKEALAVLNSELSKALGRLRITPKPKEPGFVWSWSKQPLELESPIGPLAQAAANLLVSDRVSQVHQCGGNNCGWLFLDCSKNHSRRWCDMRDCGNLAKVRRHRAKQKS